MSAADGLPFTGPWLLAPMEGVTEPCFRDTVIELHDSTRLGGAFTEFLRVTQRPRSEREVLEWLGPRWYRLAAATTPLPSVAAMLRDVADGFDHARRFLTMITDRYLFEHRRWFGPSAA